MHQRRPDDFGQRNLLLQLLLGLVRWGDDLDALLEVHAPAGASAVPPEPPDHAEHALLGAIAFIQLLRAHCDAIEPPSAEVKPPHAVTMTSLLR